MHPEKKMHLLMVFLWGTGFGFHLSMNSVRGAI